MRRLQARDERGEEALVRALLVLLTVILLVTVALVARL